MARAGTARKKNLIGSAILMAFILAFLVVGLTVGLRHTPETDEIRYHLPATLQYMEQFPHLDLRNYQSASGPLPYVIFMFWARAFGANIVSLRVAVMLFGLLTLLVAWALLEGEKLSTRVLITLLLFLHPYFLFRSFSLYTVVPALFFGLLSLLMLRKYEANHPRYFFLLAYVICSTAAVTSRQVYLSYALGVPLFAMASRLPRVRNLFSHGVRHSYGSVVLMIVPVLILGLLVLHWGGLTPPMFASYNYSGVNFAHVDFMLVFLGFWFWPLCLDNLKRVPKWVYLVAALAAVHLIWTPLPLYKADPKESYLGVIGAVYTWLAGLNLPLLLLKTSQIVLWVLGVVILVLLGQQRDEPYALISLVHFVIMLSVPFVWERYYFAAFPTVWLALRRDVRDPRLYIPLVLQQAGLSVQYFTTHS